MSHLDQVQAKLKSQVPLITHMGIEVVSWDGATVQMEAPLTPNLNTHGTAFGGSLYCVAAMTGWSLVHLTLLAVGHDPSVWLVKGEVEYKTPVRGMIKASATFDEEQRQHLIKGYEQRGRVKSTVNVSIFESDQLAVKLAAVYAAMKHDP